MIGETMAANTYRSMNVELRNGLLDGTVRSVTPNHSGQREREMVATRDTLDPEIYGLVGSALDVARFSYPLPGDDLR